MIYLDNAATTKPIDLDNDKYRSNYGNASSLHEVGRTARALIEQSRSVIAKCINAEPCEIFFTSGGTESNNLALSLLGSDTTIIKSEIEHPSIHNFKNDYSRSFSEKQLMNSDSYSQMFGHKFLVSAMLVNNETGYMHDIDVLSRMVKRHGGFVHTDAVQALGHVPVDVKKLNVDMLSGSAHKFHGPKGVGFLYVSKDIKDNIEGQLMYGGHQERGLRPGTYNTQGICEMAYALEYAVNSLSVNMQKWGTYKKQMIEYIVDNIHGSEINGRISGFSNNILNVSFKDVRGEELMSLLDLSSVCVSTGSACNSSSKEPSYVFKALGYDNDRANSSIRISMSAFTTQEDIDYFLLTLKACVEMLRGEM